MDLILTTGLYLALIDPADPKEERLYSSGIYESDKYPYNPWPASENALLNMPYHFFNEKFEMCSPGFYDAHIDIKNNKIILLQGNAIKARLNAGLEETQKHLEIPKAYVQKDNTYITIITYIKGKKAFSKLSFPR